MHEESLEESHSEKYLCDIISDKGTLDETRRQRKLKGCAYISEIRALVSFGHRNGILWTSEAWHNKTKKHIEELAAMDRSLLKYILKAHSKDQNEFLYLETGVLGIKQIKPSRRSFYLHTLLQRNNEELYNKNLKCTKENPLKGDLI